MENIKIRLYSYKSFRHYGGREITTTPHTCEAELVKTQPGHQPYICRLLTACSGYPAGHLIAVREKDYNV